jgi:hypothetical protein
MKKLVLTLLLLPLVGLSQTVSGNMYVDLSFSNITRGGAVRNDSGLITTRVGDEIQMEFNLEAFAQEDLNSIQSANFKYLTFDVAYNNDVFTPTGHEDWPQINALGDLGEIKETYVYENQLYTQQQINRDGVQARHADWESYGGYVSNDKWTVIRITFQLSNKNIGDLFTDGLKAPAVYIKRFTIKEGADTAVDAGFMINLGTMYEPDGDQLANISPNNYTTGNSDNAEYILDGYIFPSTAPITTLQYILNDNLNPTDFESIVMEMSSTDSTTVVTETSYPLDIDGKIQIPDLEIDKTYSAWLRPVNTSYIPNVHTITDAYRSFKGLNDKGVNGNQSVFDAWEEFTADLNLDGNFNSGDVWGLLGYVLGLDVNSQVPDNFCVPEQQNGEWFHGCTSVTKYELYTVEHLTGYFNEGSPNWQPFFTVTDQSVTHNFAYWHHGDLDFSHSTPYPINNSSGKGSVYSNKAVASTSIDMVSRVEGDKVILELNHSGRDFVGMQARIDFDTSILEFENIEYATGSTAMNFTKNVNNELLIGALIKEGDANIEKGRIFRLEFKTKSNVTNTTGLFYFKNTDAVQKDGNKLELNIQ